jgi:hypothetical protein
LYMEPRRMWRRYLIGNLEFASIVLRQRLRRAFLDTFVNFINEDKFAAELSELTIMQQNKPVEIRPNINAREVEGLTTPTL